MPGYRVGVSPEQENLIAVVKADCPTCRLVVPVLGQLSEAAPGLRVYFQDAPEPFEEHTSVLIDDTELERSYQLRIETVPTLVRMRNGHEEMRVEGWARDRWEELSGVAGLGLHLPEQRPGCGSRTLEPDIAERLAVRHRAHTLRSGRVALGDLEDEVEAAFVRGWSDGLPVVPPTEARVLRMLEGTARAPEEVVATVPPALTECTVEKVAVNAVMAGCRPEYLPVVLAAVEAACTDDFNVHGVTATTYFVGPIVIVNGPIARAIGMNSGVNALGQGNRANATIGRALQLVIRNIGGGRPGEVDRATLGQPGKYTFCFAEDEDGSPWEPLAQERGYPREASTVTLFAGEAPRAVFDQRSRDAESLARSYAACLRTVAHPKLALAYDALLVVSPEHGRVFRQSGWSKQRLRDRLYELLQLPGDEVARGAGGIAEGMPGDIRGRKLSKLRPEALMFVHAGGRAGLFSAIIGSWVAGEAGSIPVSKEVVT